MGIFWRSAVAFVALVSFIVPLVGQIGPLGMVELLLLPLSALFLGLIWKRAASFSRQKTGHARRSDEYQ